MEHIKMSMGGGHGPLTRFAWLLIISITACKFSASWDLEIARRTEVSVTLATWDPLVLNLFDGSYGPFPFLLFWLASL